MVDSDYVPTKSSGTRRSVIDAISGSGRDSQRTTHQQAQKGGIGMDSVRAWKDPEYRRTLATPPRHPSGTPGSASSTRRARGSSRRRRSGARGVTKTATLVSSWCVVSLAVC
ncbi:mersacidin/lichenicidin family type 2 lantibiotic [Streptomyces sp. KL116D]|uniref:mersacidin/lichenicidin family type 2 lantibiotic n=1 Tax=Streptomyces sp. KL116D TaxID=3045152 RepID=UPI003557CC6F